MKKLKKLKTEGFNYIGVFLTFSCPRGCSYCLNELVEGLQPRKSVEGQNWVAALNRIQTDIPLTFNGGEPLSHPDFFGIINGLRKDLKVNLLTTLPYDVQDFIENLDPKRFEMDLPYAAIRVTYHPETMNLEETIEKVKSIKSDGFDIEINLVNHPHFMEETEKIRRKVVGEGLGCVVKPFLGYLNGTLHGQYRYAGSCSMKTRRNVHCRTSVLIIDPLGDIYRCYTDMFHQNREGIVGSIFQDEINLPSGYTSCNNFGFCHPCDVQIKFDRLGNWGYTAVDIIGDGVRILSSSTIDWRIS